MVNEARHRLKALRNRAGLRSRDVAERVDMLASSYQKYEDRRRGIYLPLQMVAKLVLALEPHGIDPAEVWALADAKEVAAFHRAWALKTDSHNPREPVEVQPDHSIEANSLWRDDGRRRHERWNPLPATVALNGTRELCVVKDISPGGACVLSTIASDLEDNVDVSLELTEFGRATAKVVHLEGNEIGLKFSHDSEIQIAGWLAPMRALNQ